MDWLPTTAKEIEALGWDQPDVILFTGDAYVDHPSFGAAVIGRVLEHEGLKVAIVPQPNWRDDLRDFKKLGTPKLFFGVTSGNMDSMINIYTANKRYRSEDAYTPSGTPRQRPEYAVKVYCNILKTIYPNVPIVIGGIEASLRRFSHYDYWSNSIFPSILKDSKADLLVYGMGEKTIQKVAISFKEGKTIDMIRDIPQTAYLINKNEFKSSKNDLFLHSHSDCLKDKKKYIENFTKIEGESNKYYSDRIIQHYDDAVLVVNPTEELLSELEMDAIFDLPFTRLPHPRYYKKGPIPAYEMIKFSINIHRGCFGGCSFCTISAHQGKFVASRSESSILKEIEHVSQLPDFKGYLSDLGGPTANMYKMKGIELDQCKKCNRNSCIYPSVCKNLDASHDKLIALYKKVSKLPFIKKAFIGSGVRYDIFLRTMHLKGNKEYAEELIRFHVSGRLKVAPEHTRDSVLKLMRKPSFDLYLEFHRIFNELNRKFSLNQQIVPYFISAHPGCKNADMESLSDDIRDLNLKPEQVQDFTPTPMTYSTEMYYSGINPYDQSIVYIPKGEDREKQKNYFFWYKKENKTIFTKHKTHSPIAHPKNGRSRRIK